MNSLVKFLFWALVFMISSCDENQLLSLDKEETPESIWFEVLQKINSKDFDEAIILLDQVPDEIKLKRENLIRYSSAYAGFCGLDLIALVNDATGLNGQTPLEFLREIFVEPTVEKLQACETAIAIIEDNVSDLASQRNVDENIAVMAYLMTGIGLFLNSKFDTNNDTVLDPGADTCNAAQLTDPEAAILGANLTKMFNASLNISNVELLQEIQEEVDAGCDELNGVSPILNFCSKQDPLSFTPSEIRGVRSIVQEGVIFGIGTCGATPKELANCICL